MHSEHQEHFASENDEQAPEGLDNNPLEAVEADIQAIEDYANQNGFGPEDTKATIADLEQRKQAAENMEPADQIEAVAEDIELMAQKLDGIEAGLGSAMGELYELQDTLQNFFGELTKLLQELEDYLNRIAKETDPAEKERLKAELQTKINTFGRQ